MGFYDLWGFFDKNEVPRDVLRGGPPKPRPPTPGLNFPAGTYIPDYRIYKVADCPELLEVEKRLAARGLKSPWLRNDVWRFERRSVGSKRWRHFYIMGLGFKYGVPFFGICMIYELYFKKPNPNLHHYENLYYKNCNKSSHDSHH